VQGALTSTVSTTNEFTPGDLRTWIRGSREIVKSQLSALFAVAGKGCRTRRHRSLHTPD
jgi:hypothetical protein